MREGASLLCPGGTAQSMAESGSLPEIIAEYLVITGSSEPGRECLVVSERQESCLEVLIENG